MSKILYNIDEAVAATSIGRTTLYELIREGKIKIVKVGRRSLIHVDELQRFAAKLMANAA